jgi:transposase
MFSLPFQLPDFAVTSVTDDDTTVMVYASAQQAGASCPHCHHPSQSIHSYYSRSPQDLPISGKTVRLVLRVRRFRCQNSECPQRTFAERCSEIVAPHGQRTKRLTASITPFGGEVSSEPAARLLRHMGILVSSDTLLRLVKRTAEQHLSVPKALGVDDFAFRRGHSYGTLLVDLTSHRPVDVLPDRSADTLSRWLRAHPGVKYLSRDRSPEYARGASEGAPSAQQVVDRWHLLKNLREVLERVLGRVHETLKQRQLASGLLVRARRRRQRSTNEHTASQMARLRREARYEDVVALYKQGVPVLRIAEDLHMSRTTVRKFVAAGAFPERATTLRSKSILDPYIPYLKQRLEQGPANASQLWRDVRERGFPGSYKVIARWVQAQGWQLRKGRFSQARRIQEPFIQIATTGTTPFQEHEQPEQAKASPRTTLEEPLESPRHLVWLLLRDPARLSETEEHMLTFIRQEPTVELAYTLAQRFIQMMHEHQSAKLDSWISTCTSSGIADLETFALGLQKELSAIKAAFTLSYSTGPVEGQVNRLKLIKRSMYNRGSFALLRQRVLYVPSTSDPLHESCG